MFRFLRIAILLTILVIVAGNQLLTDNRRANWDKPLWITVYPIVSDSNTATRRYVDSLTPASFENITTFIEQQAARYNLDMETPLIFQLGRPMSNMPPPLPKQSSGFGVALWSLKMRWWVWRNSDEDGLAPGDIKMFVVYQSGQNASSLERSVGIKNASYGVVNALASRNWGARNRIVLAHELLHILGASDKYNLANGQPIAPEGLGNPLQLPVYPQNRAEIMGGRISTSPTSWSRPATLKSCVIGDTTAREIGWL